MEEPEIEKPFSVEGTLKEYIYKLLGLLGKLIAILIKMLPAFALYGFLSWIYLSIYASYGFEPTLILLLVGVIVFALRKN